MKIYVSHASTFDYHVELYEPLKRGFAGVHEFIFPHTADGDVNSKEVIKTCDIVLAEASFPSTGQGIELGWADAAGVPIVCIYKQEAAPSQALRHISENVFSYVDAEDLITQASSALLRG